MKLQLDTKEKTIKLEENVNLQELTEMLEKLLPKGLWKKFTLETNTTINTWSNPIIIRERYPDRPRYPDYPWYDNKTYQLNSSSGVYNIEY